MFNAVVMEILVVLVTPTGLLIVNVPRVPCSGTSPLIEPAPAMASVEDASPMSAPDVMVYGPLMVKDDPAKLILPSWVNVPVTLRLLPRKRVRPFLLKVRFVSDELPDVTRVPKSPASPSPIEILDDEDSPSELPASATNSSFNVRV